MALRDKVTEAMPQVPKGKAYSSDYPFYYKDYRDNLFCPMGEQAYHAYQQGSGSELLPCLRTIVKQFFRYSICLPRNLQTIWK